METRIRIGWSLFRAHVQCLLRNRTAAMAGRYRTWPKSSGSRRRSHAGFSIGSIYDSIPGFESFGSCVRAKRTTSKATFDSESRDSGHSSRYLSSDHQKYPQASRWPGFETSHRSGSQPVAIIVDNASHNRAGTKEVRAGSS